MGKMTKMQIRVAELKRIAVKHKGVLSPEVVVEEAKEKSSPLHACFTWDDSTAAQEYRLWEARRLIAVSVEYIGAIGQDVRVFVSLKSDRGAGGYRQMLTVMDEGDKRNELLQNALEDLAGFRLRYQHLDELAGIFIEEEKIRQRMKLKMNV
jgi:hypothetical protein